MLKCSQVVIVKKCLLHFVGKCIGATPFLHCVLQGIFFSPIGGCGWNRYNYSDVGPWCTIEVRLPARVWWQLMPEDSVRVYCDVIREPFVDVCGGLASWGGSGCADCRICHRCCVRGACRGVSLVATLAWQRALWGTWLN